MNGEIKAGPFTNFLNHLGVKFIMQKWTMVNYFM